MLFERRVAGVTLERLAAAAFTALYQDKRTGELFQTCFSNVAVREGVLKMPMLYWRLLHPLLRPLLCMKTKGLVSC